MNKILAVIISLLVGWLRTLADNLKLNLLKKSLKDKQERAEGAANEATESYRDFMDKYHDWLESGGAHGDMPESIEKLRSRSGEAANCHKGARRRTSSSGTSRSRARAAAGRRQKGS